MRTPEERRRYRVAVTGHGNAARVAILQVALSALHDASLGCGLKQNHVLKSTTQALSPLCRVK
jgi:hypothetical protein